MIGKEIIRERVKESEEIYIKIVLKREKKRALVSEGAT